MNIRRISILSALVLLAGAACVQAKSPKRGVSENQFQYNAQLEALKPGVSWYYNWGNAPGRNVAGFEGMEFVPMCWNGNYNAQTIRDWVKDHPETKYLLGFNEPNFTAQANMTPSEAAQAWPAVRALADELGLKLVAPALNYSPNPPYQDPVKWMDEFVALVGPDAFDYVALHNYGGFGVMQDLCTRFHDRYGKDVWVTEFCLWPNEGDANSTVTPAAQIASMVQTVQWLEQTEWIFRYAWFKAIGNSSASKGPNYGLLLSGKGEEPRELSQQGSVYVYMGDFNPDVWYQPGQTVAATDYIDQSNCLLGASGDAVRPLDISQFNAGAWAQWQWDIPEAGDYVFEIKVGGEGEPTRFDPTLAVMSVGEDGRLTTVGVQRQFALPGDGNGYVTESWTLSLPAGHVTLRLADMAPYTPSGIRIATVSLYDPSGVGEIIAGPSDAKVDVYSLQGIRLRQGVMASEALEGLPEGIYIAGGRKIRKSAK